MQTLHLPLYEAKTRLNAQGRTEIYDTLRRRFVALTPEEWVRQQFVHYLIDHLHYPAGLMGNEISLNLNGVRRRCDTVLYHRDGGRPRLIIEYKAPQVVITQETFRQISSYNSVLRVDYLIVTNGREHFVLHMDYQSRQSAFLPSIPDYRELL